MDLGVDVVGGIPYFERKAGQRAERVRILCEVVAERGLPVDMHCAESDDPLRLRVDTLALQTQRLGPQAPRHRLAPDDHALDGQRLAQIGR